MASCCLIFKLRLLSQSFCVLASTQTPWFVLTNPKKAWKHSLSVNLHKFVVVCCSRADSVAVRSNHFLLVEWLFDAKVLLNGHAVTQNYVFVVFQSEATKNNSHNQLIRHVEETMVMKILVQFGTNVNYMAYICDCLIEMCNTHTINFGYQTLFSLTIFLQVIFSMKSLWLFTVSLRTRSDDGKHRNKSCTGEHCFFWFEKCGFNWT